jgi:hypothetical protein
MLPQGHVSLLEAIITKLEALIAAKVRGAIEEPGWPEELVSAIPRLVPADPHLDFF